MENLKCAACGTVLVSKDVWTACALGLARILSPDGTEYRIEAECARCGYEGEPAPLESSKRVEKPPERVHPEIVETRVAGFRSWKVNEGKLTAIHRYTAWTPGDNRASCHIHGDKAPVAGHACGFNAFYRFDEWERQEGGDRPAPTRQWFDATRTVCGIASASGRTVLHEAGWHAEVARVEALIAYRPDVPALGGFVSVRPLLETIAETYGVPVISPDEAEMFCSVEGLKLMEPMVGAESEVEPDLSQTHVYLSARYAGPATGQNTRDGKESKR